MNACDRTAAQHAEGASDRRRGGARSRSRRRGIASLSYLLVLLVSAAGTVGALHSQAAADERVREQFTSRSAQAAGFVSTFADQLLAREQAVAADVLAADDPAEFASVAAAFGFQAAVLLDAEGDLLAIAPPAPQLLGEPLGKRYAHLRQALEGRRAVSNVVASAAQRESVIAFAAPYDTPQGRRVLSGAYRVSQTPLRQYLDGMSVLPGFRAYVVDAQGKVVAGSGPVPSRVTTLSDTDPATAQALETGDDVRYATSAVIAGTPWHLVTSVPEAALLRASRGAVRLQVAGLALLTLIGLVACWLGLRLRDQRGELEVANRRLDELAHLDGLTGLSNRRRLDEHLLRGHERSRALGVPLSVLIIDIDHFKRVNDTFGHGAGDGVLRDVAERIRDSVRDGDTVGRWGGEEFLVVLPCTPPGEAAAVAERIRDAVAGAAFDVGTGGDLLHVTVSIGCYGDSTSVPDVLVNVADRALYSAKTSGRDRVVLPQRAQHRPLALPHPRR